MKILGIGFDIVETERIAQALEKFGDKFLRRIYTPNEIEYCRSMKFPNLHFAARFAAKEAISKAFGTGIGAAIGWKEMEIVKRTSGEPYVQLHGGAEEHARKLHVCEVWVSLSHTEKYGAANALVAVRE